MLFLPLNIKLDSFILPIYKRNTCVSNKRFRILDNDATKKHL